MVDFTMRNNVATTEHHEYFNFTFEFGLIYKKYYLKNQTKPKPNLAPKIFWCVVDCKLITYTGYKDTIILFRLIESMFKLVYSLL